MDVIGRLLAPHSVAVVGASADPVKTSGRPVLYLQKHGYAGKIFPVNPRGGRFGDLTCYQDIASLPETPEVAIVLLGAEHAHHAVHELALRGTPAAIVLASGYAEIDEEGAARQRQLVEAAGPMRLLGPNTIGLVNLTDRIVLSASGALAMDRFPAGRIGVVSQSGGILGALLSRAAARGIGLSKLVSTGNEADLDLADFVDHLAGDDATQVIALYVEGIRHASKFRAAADRARRAGKPVVVFKVGRSEAGAQAAASHTGALAGSDRMYDAFFRELGILRARHFGDLLDIAAALASGRRLHGRRVAILTSTGGAGTLISDSLGVAGFESPAPDANTAEALRGLQTGNHSALDRNPIDVTLAGLQPKLLRGVISTLLASPTYDALVVIVGSSGLAQPELMADAIGACLPASDKPVIAFLSPHAPEVGSVLTLRGVPAYTTPESCAVALAGMLQAQVQAQAQVQGQALARAQEPVRAQAPAAQVPEPGIASTLARRAADTAIGDFPSGALDEAQAKALFARFGVPVVDERIVVTAQEAQSAAAELGGRVVLKILSSRILHKSDVGGVAVDVDCQELGSRLARMGEEVFARTGERPGRFLVQKKVAGGIELILGMHRDALGTAILLGTGGVTAELFKDTTLRFLPSGRGFDREEANAMARELVGWPILDGYRGRPKADVDALADTIMAFSAMVSRLGERLMDAEINPLFVLPQGQGVVAADGLAVLAGPGA